MSYHDLGQQLRVRRQEPNGHKDPTHDLAAMVEAHYDDDKLRRLEGEIHFDDELSTAEIQAAERGLVEVTGRGWSPVVYAPAAGTLRHVPPLLERGVQRVVAVDLSGGSLLAGVAHYGERIAGRVDIHQRDIRDTGAFMPEGGFGSAFMLGNSIGDVTDLEGHMAFIEALGAPLQPGAGLVFDYVGNRYVPGKPGEVQRSVWNETYRSPEGERIPVLDQRSRVFVPLSNGLGRLEFTCQVTTPDGEVVVPEHGYQKLIVPDDILRDQFASVGMDLHPLGPIRNYSPYHAQRIDTRDDLGMMGRPNSLYVAVKR